MISHVYHDWHLNGIYVDGDKVVLSMYCNNNGNNLIENSSIIFNGCKKMLLNEFVIDNIILRIDVKRISESDRSYVHEFFIKYDHQGYFDDDASLFFSKIDDDDIVVEIIPVYGASLCCICSNIQEKS